MYPGNLKEKKTFIGLTVLDLAITGTLSVIFIITAAQSFSLIPLTVPIIYLLLKIRILEDGSNILMQIMKGFNYIISSQQTYFWGEGKENK